MSRTPRTTLLVLLAAAVSVATAAAASARPWPGDPVPDPATAVVVADQAGAGTSPLWHFLLVAALTGLVVGTVVYLAASRRRQGGRATRPPATEISAVSVG